MGPITWIRKLISALRRRRCLHEWAPSQSQSGWTCVRCGLHEESGESRGDAAV